MPRQYQQPALAMLFVCSKSSQTARKRTHRLHPASAHLHLSTSQCTQHNHCHNHGLNLNPRDATAEATQRHHYRAVVPLNFAPLHPHHPSPKHCSPNPSAYPFTQQPRAQLYPATRTDRRTTNHTSQRRSRPTISNPTSTSQRSQTA